MAHDQGRVAAACRLQRCILALDTVHSLLLFELGGNLFCVLLEHLSCARQAPTAAIFPGRGYTTFLRLATFSLGGLMLDVLTLSHTLEVVRCEHFDAKTNAQTHFSLNLGKFHLNILF